MASCHLHKSVCLRSALQLVLWKLAIQSHNKLFGNKEFLVCLQTSIIFLPGQAMRRRFQLKDKNTKTNSLLFVSKLFLFCQAFCNDYSWIDLNCWSIFTQRQTSNTSPPVKCLSREEDIHCNAWHWGNWIQGNLDEHVIKSFLWNWNIFNFKDTKTISSILKIQKQFYQF